jgi:hypothetical protein
VALVLGRVFQALGLSRHAALRASPVTAAILGAHGNDGGGDGGRPAGRESGWRTCQAELARAYLTAADPALDGASRLDRIRAERFGAWARSRAIGAAGRCQRCSPGSRLPGVVSSDARDPAAAHDGLRLNL